MGTRLRHLLPDSRPLSRGAAKNYRQGVDESEVRERFRRARIGRLATIGFDGPHVVPIVFAVVGDHIVTAVDHKPKKSRQLRRLANIESDPRVSLIVDEYHDVWDHLWWVRADGIAEVRSVADERLLEALIAKYPQYGEITPTGPFIQIAVVRWRGWTAQ